MKHNRVNNNILKREDENNREQKFSFTRMITDELTAATKTECFFFLLIYLSVCFVCDYVRTQYIIYNQIIKMYK